MMMIMMMMIVGRAVAQLVEAFRYSPEGRGFDCRAQWPIGLRRGSASDWECRFESRRWHGCFVLCMLYRKDKRQKLGQSGQRKRERNPAGGIDFCVVCCK